MKGSRLEGAKSRYEELGLNTHLNKEWDSIVSNKSPWTVVYVKGHFTWKATEHPAANTYLARDHYGLIADGTGIGYVTLIENDNPDTTQVSEGLPVQMHVIKVVPELYADGIAVLSDSLNKLSEKLTLLYRTPLGSTSDKYEFQWCYTTPETDGTVPGQGDRLLEGQGPGDGPRLGAARRERCEPAGLREHLLHAALPSGQGVGHVGTPRGGWRERSRPPTAITSPPT